jgi:hypothetical protein
MRKVKKIRLRKATLRHLLSEVSAGTPPETSACRDACRPSPKDACLPVIWVEA